jgi:hypothetical protein
MLNKVTSWLVLIYFLVIIIPPVSAFAETDSMNSLVEFHPSNQARLFLIDLLEWQQMAQTKRGESFINIYSLAHGYDNKETGRTLIKFVDPVAESVHLAMGTFAQLELQQTTFARYHLSHIRYARSDVSPPYLS